MEERCANQRPRVYDLIGGTYVLRVPVGCLIDSDMGWSFTALIAEHLDIELDNVFSVDVPMDLIPPTMTPYNSINYSHIDYVVRENVHALSHTSNLRHVRYVQLTGSIFGYVALLIILMLCAAIAIYWKCRKLKNGQCLGVKYTPTTEKVEIVETSEASDKPQVKPLWPQFGESIVKDV